jgi:hypothetical protein
MESQSLSLQNDKNRDYSFSAGFRVSYAQYEAGKLPIPQELEIFRENK